MNDCRCCCCRRLVLLSCRDRRHYYDVNRRFRSRVHRHRFHTNVRRYDYLYSHHRRCVKKNFYVLAMGALPKS